MKILKLIGKRIGFACLMFVILLISPFTWCIGQLYQWLGKRHDRKNNGTYE